MRCIKVSVNILKVSVNILYKNHNVRKDSMDQKVKRHSKAHFPHRREHQDFYRLSKHRWVSYEEIHVSARSR